MIAQPTFSKPLGPRVLTILLLTLSPCVYSQDLTNQTSFFIPAGLELHLDGNFINDGFIQNQGSFFVTGDWKNTNVYQGIGKVILEGDVRQDFYNNKNAVFHLVVDGPGVKHITDLLPVTNQLDLFQGIVEVNDQDTLLLAENATATGGSIDSYVEGEFTHTGTGLKFFPIGKNGNYNPVDMLNISGIQPITSLELFENLPEIKSPAGIKVYTAVYWQRKTIGGTFIDSPLSIGYTIPDNYTNRHVIEVVEGDELNTEFSSLGRVTVTYDDVLDKLTTENGSTRKFFAIGESNPKEGIEGEFYISTSLAPRATSLDNQVVKIFGNVLIGENFKFLVFNRWGLLVYESGSLEQMILNGWDGRSQGTGDYLPAGAYPYVLRALTADGGSMERKGIISIVN